MRSEKEMFDLIMNFANQDDRIRLVVLNGSRVNPEAPKDPFQDFDVACFVTDVAPYWKNMDIVNYFGSIMMLQEPEDMEDPPAENNGHYTYLMQFMDGNRVDLSFEPLDRIATNITDSLTLVLLDKDNLVPGLPAPNLSGYLPQKPTGKLFDDCCNEFWWLGPNVAKGLWRDEIPYAWEMFEYKREQFMKMITWYVGVNTNFEKSPGKMGKYLKNYLSPESWEMFLRTYPDSDPERIWDAMFTMNDLFRCVAREVAAHFKFTYPEQYDKNVTGYLQHVRKLPRDASVIY